MDRTIIHCDMNSFYASVELLDYPDLRDEPVAVCGDPKNRHGIILAKNEIAKSFGVLTAETIYSARKKCPNLKTLPPNRYKYSHYSKLINKVYERYTDLIEPFSIDESWLDVTASLKLFGSGKEIADDIRSVVKNEFGLTLSAGVSYNKMLAKMGSDYKKPDATTVITRENFKDLLWHLPVNELFFVGKAASKKLISIGIKTIGNLALSDKKMITAMLGKNGTLIHNYANGIDHSPVVPKDLQGNARSIGHGVTFKRNLITEADIKTAIIALSDKVCFRMRKNHIKAGGVKIDITDTNFKSMSRQTQLLSPSNTSKVISDAAELLIKKHWIVGKPIRLLSITGINLIGEEEPVQLSLFDEVKENKYIDKPLDKALDNIRTKYGKASITYGRLINNDLGLNMDEEKPQNSKK